MTSVAKRNYRSELRDLNWDFSGEGGADAISNSHWYPARYIRQVPGVLIGYFSGPGDFVLDPFCGSGTTLIEAARVGRHSLGIDMNPIATLIGRAKCAPVCSSVLAAYVDEIMAEATDAVITGRACMCAADEVRAERAGWFDSRTLIELESIWSAIEAHPGECQVVAQASFSAILRSVSSQDKHWGWICDNVKPKELVYRDAFAAFVRKVADFASVVDEISVLRRHGEELAESPLTTTVLTGSSEEQLDEVESGTVDLVVTSPPYYGVTDYIRSQRLSFLWIDGDIDRLKMSETGARFKRFRKAALSEYLDDLERCFRQVSRVLKRGKVCAMVIGESPSRESYLPRFVKMLSSLGLELEDELDRRIPVRRSFNPYVKTETIMIFRRLHD